MAGWCHAVFYEHPMNGKNLPAWLKPTWLKNVLRPFVYRPHETVTRYMAPADLDRSAELARARVQGSDIAVAFWAHEGRLAHKWPHFFPIYERAFSRFREGFTPPGGSARPLRFLEIGVSQGGSLQLWRTYFGGRAVIFGVDIDPRCAAVNDPDLNVRIGSQADPAFLSAVVEEMGGVDIVLDDGSHIAQHQRASLDVLWPLLSEGGLYVIEDAQTAYWRAWQGGYRKSGTIIETAKAMVDDMHARYHVNGAERTFADSEVASITFHDGIIVIEKGSRGPSYHTMVGTPTFS
jgi:Methyltransferase domain